MATSYDGVTLLLTLAGRKSYVAEILARSAAAGRLLAADADPEATVRHAVDRFAVVPPVEDEGSYIASLVAICKENRVDGVVALNDLDLPALARHRPRFSAVGSRVLGAAPEVVGVLRDKLEIGPWLAERNLRYPRTVVYEPERPCPLGFPVLAKTRFGQGSRDQRVCRSDGDLRGLRGAFVLQELLVGEEYNLDVLRAPDGEVKAVVPKRKLAMVDGSTDKAVSVEAPELVELGVRLGEGVAHVGSIDVDVMVAGGDSYVLDVNARVGGGFPFTALVCPAYVDALVGMARDVSPPAFLGQYRRDVVMHRAVRYFEVS